eukprot:TRINITY_DN21125_c0_g1_i1.p1 TRINITY_DN21125_c0_g1~~TRINITY_DN21125_c0_g1_i1.p1  ORF type:complete len:310 (-),score=22.89 TRINITY_DN21125_c0_g1_i1:426-1355(-)
MHSDYDKSLKDAEDNLNTKANQMGRLKVEFDHNLNKLQESYYPKMRPLKEQVYQSLHQRAYIEKEAEWKQRILDKMRQYGDDFNEERHLMKERDEELALILPKFQDAIASLKALTPEDMSVLRKYEHPPGLVLDTMEAVLTLKGEMDNSWEAAQVILSDTYFFRFFLNRAENFDKDSVSEELLDQLKAIMLNPDFEPVVVAAASIPCGALCKWVRSVYEYARIKRMIRCNGLTEDELLDDIERLQEQQNLKKEEISGAEQKLQGLQAEFTQRKKDLKARYDQTMEPLQETFFEAHHRFGAAYCSPRRKN